MMNVYRNVNLDNVNLKTLVVEVLQLEKCQKVDAINTISQQMTFIVSNDWQSSDDDLDNVISTHNKDVDLTPKIFSIVDSSVKNKSHRAINYKNELANGHALHPVETFLPNGLIDTVTYYFGYVDAGNPGEEILKVSHDWVTDVAEPIPAAQDVLTRTKTWEWKNNDGNYNDDKKSKPKNYDTRKKKNSEGKRRRGDNLLNAAQEGVATILLVTGTAADVPTATNMMIDLFETYEKSFATYVKSGKGSIYDDMENDVTFPWTKTVIGATAAGYLGLDASYNTKQIWEYTNDKLKGLI